MSPTTTRSPQHGFALDEWESSADTRQGTSLRSNESPSSDSDAIQTIFQDILGLEECPSRASLFSMGGHSVDAIQILSSTRERFGVDVSMEDFLDDPSVDTLTRLVQAASPTPAVGIDRDPEFVVEAEPTLARHDPPQEEHPTDAPKTNRSKLDFSLFFFSGDEQECQVDKYQLVLEAARFADAHGFHAIWTPERHFHRFGGLYPNPAVLGAAIATVTRRIQLRAGSVVLPLHHPIRVAEEWSVVDNLSRGRVGIAFAAGFHPHDFLLHPDHFEQRRSLVLEGIDTFRSLWRGESFDGLDGNGKQVSVRSYPRPVQAEPPIWIAAGTKPESFVAAGRQGLHLLTAPLQLSFEELERYIAMYREARAAAGHTPESGHVTMMLHTYIGEDLEEVRKTVRPAFLQYLQNHSELTRSMVDDWDELGTEDHHALFEFAFERYFNSSSLFGTIESCLETVRRMNAIGVDEIACLLDFGLDLPTTLSGLERIVSLSELYKEEAVNP